MARQRRSADSEFLAPPAAKPPAARPAARFRPERQVILPQFFPSLECRWQSVQLGSRQPAAGRSRTICKRWRVWPFSPSDPATHLLYLPYACVLVQRTREAQVSEKERYDRHRGHVHPPIGYQDTVLLKTCEEGAPARHWFGYPKSQHGKSHRREYELGHEDRRLRQDDARGFGQNVAPKEIT